MLEPVLSDVHCLREIQLISKLLNISEGMTNRKFNPRWDSCVSHPQIIVRHQKVYYLVAEKGSIFLNRFPTLGSARLPLKSVSVVIDVNEQQAKEKHWVTR